jgi:hypothetical protein
LRGTRGRGAGIDEHVDVPDAGNDGGDRKALIVVVRVVVYSHPVMEWGIGRVGVVVRIGRDRGGALFGLGLGVGLRVESGGGFRGGGGLGLPFDHGVPVLTLFLIEFVLPFCLRVFAVFADMTALVAARAIAAFDVIVELTLRLRGNLIAINDCLQVRPLKTGGEFRGLFVVGAACEVGVSRVFRLIALLLVFGFGFVALSPLVLHLCSFFFVFRLGF